MEPLPVPTTRSTSSSRRHRVVAVTVVATLVLAACGGDDDGGAEPSARELRSICRGGEALYQAAAREDFDEIDEAIEELDAADAEELTDLDLDELTELADEGELGAIEDAFADVGCDDVGATPTTEPEVTQPPTTEPDTTEPDTTEPPTTEPPTTTQPETTEPPTTEPDTTEPPTETTEPATTGDPTGFVMVEFEAGPLAQETAINPLLDGQPVDVLTTYGLEGMLVPASANAQLVELDVMVSSSTGGETRRRTDTAVYIVDTDTEPDDLRGLFRAAVEPLADFNFRESSSERDGITTLSFDADVAQFDQTIPNWSVAVSESGTVDYLLVSVRRTWGDAPVDLDDLPAPVDAVLAEPLERGDAAGWARRGFFSQVGVNIFNGQPSDYYSADFATDNVDLDAAVDELLAVLDGAETDETTSTDTRAVVDADGGRWLFLQSSDNPVNVSYSAPTSR